ncbi:MAG: OmpH family outer membrane protein [Pyrinomonadaceae bacterium]|jgi:Skp family chaperone for outer membrane proteins|nr:OmpH family outer membrane protein [Pyrinomonadaceae bacterium]
MKLILSTFAAALAVLAPVAAAAQQPATGRPAVPSAQGPAAASPTTPQNTGVVGDGKIAIIDTEAFADPKTGITRLVSAFEVVNREFKPRSDELQKLRAQYEQLGKDIEATRTLEDQRARAAKVEQAEALKNDIERKTQDAQSAYQKRLREATEPVYKEISPALQAFARQRGVNVIFDVSKLGEVMFIINDSVDLTRAFITEYNQRNPVTATPPRQ